MLVTTAYYNKQYSNVVILCFCNNVSVAVLVSIVKFVISHNVVMVIDQSFTPGTLWPRPVDLRNGLHVVMMVRFSVPARCRTQESSQFPVALLSQLLFVQTNEVRLILFTCFPSLHGMEMC